VHTPLHPLDPLTPRNTPLHQVFKELSYLALSMTSGVSPATVGRVKHKYNLDTPLPNAQRTLAKNNAVAQQARDEPELSPEPKPEPELET